MFAFLFGLQAVQGGALTREFTFGTEPFFDGAGSDSVAMARAIAALHETEELSVDSCNRDVLIAKLRVAEVWWEIGQLDSAFSDYKKSIATARRCLAPDDSIRILAQLNVGAFCADAGFYQIDDAIPYLRDAVAGCDSSEWCKGKVRALLMRQTAMAVEFVGDTTSRAMFRESLRLLESCDGPDSAETARALWLLRKSLFEGQYREEAHQLLERLLKLTESCAGLEFPTRGLVLSSFGEDLHLAGDDAKAVPYLREALETFVSETETSRCRIARTNGLLAKSLSDLGRFDEARPFYEAAIHMYEECGEINPPYFYVSASVDYGRDLIDHGFFEQASDVLHHAQDIADDSLARGEDAHAYLLLELARLHDFTCKANLAEEYYGHALAIAENIHSLNDPRIAYFLEPMAEFYFEQGKLALALPMQARAQKLREARYGKAHPLVAESLHRLSFMTRRSETSSYRLLDQLEVAGWWQIKAWEIQIERLRDALAILPEHQLIQLSSRLQEDSEHTYSMLIDLPVDMPLRTLAARVVPASKAQVWDVLLLKNELIAAESDPYIRELSDSLTRIREELATSFVGLQYANGSEESVQRTTYLADKKSRLTEELSYRSASFERSNHRFDPQAFMISSVMPSNSVLIDFVRYEHDLSLRESEARYLAFVIRPDSTSTLHSLGRADEIDSLVNSVTAELDDPRRLDDVEFHRCARALYKLIWAPFAEVANEADLVFVCPDGALNRIAFETLIDSSDRYLAERQVIHYLPSGRELYRIITEPKSAEVNSGLLAIGNPDYDESAHDQNSANVTMLSPELEQTEYNASQGVRQRSGTLSRAALKDKWLPLPGSGAEIGDVQSLWNALSSDSCVVLTDREATEENFKRYSGGKRVIYLATHGFSNVRLASDEIFSSNDESSSPNLLIQNNPLLQSGLLLAGANHIREDSYPGSFQDGVVTAEEIATLDMSGTDVVVLSACHTGSGKVIDGEGVYSLRRAFELAGAKTVVSSLWAVDDESTRATMSAMMNHGDKTLSQALHDGMLERLSSLRASGLSDHPYFWSGFICSGDPRTRLFPEDSAPKFESTK